MILWDLVTSKMVAPAKPEKSGCGTAITQVSLGTRLAFLRGPPHLIPVCLIVMRWHLCWQIQKAVCFKSGLYELKCFTFFLSTVVCSSYLCYTRNWSVWGTWLAVKWAFKALTETGWLSHQGHVWYKWSRRVTTKLVCILVIIQYLELVWAGYYSIFCCQLLFTKLHVTKVTICLG